jgi:hypothetical protein
MKPHLQRIQWSMLWRNPASKHVRLPAGWRPPACLTMDAHDGTLTTGVVQVRMPPNIEIDSPTLLQHVEQVPVVVALREFENSEWRAAWGNAIACIIK